MDKPKRSLSQNFIIDKNICKKIINLTNVKDKIIVEIGPGYGFMTDIILDNNPKKIILIEKDNNLTNFLKNKYKTNKKVSVIGSDVLKIDFNKYNKITIISNLPYNVSTKIILYLFEFRHNIDEMILMIQKEVAKKFDYNLKKMNKYKFLTKIVSDFNRCFDVSPKVFFPKPKILSTVVKFKFNNKDINFQKAKYFSTQIFKNIRKKISNNLKNKISSDLANKRVNQLNIKEMLIIYNFF